MGAAPPAGFLVHRLGPRHVTLKAKLVGHLSVAIAVVPVRGVRRPGLVPAALRSAVPKSASIRIPRPPPNGSQPLDRRIVPLAHQRRSLGDSAMRPPMTLTPYSGPDARA